MRILLTNNTLAYRSGSELYVRDLAMELRRRGHEPIAYSPLLGEVADDLRAATIPVTGDLRSIRLPLDVIHGHHHLETVAALNVFPGVPSIYVCHGWLPWQEIAPRHPRIRRYVAVDETVYDRLVLENGIDPAITQVLPNFVDCDRFRLRSLLPPRPRRALIFNSFATEDNFGRLVREACARHDIAVDLVGYAAERPVREPELLLPGYDLVFARARAALEAAATGCAVIVADPRGMAGMVTADNFDALRRANFGIRTLTLPVTVENLDSAISAYDSINARRVTDRVRAEASLTDAVTQYEELYTQAVAEHTAAPPDAASEREALTSYLAELSRQTKLPGFAEWTYLKSRCDMLALDAEALRGRLRQAEASNGAETAMLRTHIDAYAASPFIRLRNRLYHVRPLVWLYRLFAKHG